MSDLFPNPPGTSGPSSEDARQDIELDALAASLAGSTVNLGPITQRVTNLEASQATQNTQIGSNTTAIASVSTIVDSQTSAINTLSGISATQSTAISALQSSDTSQNTRLSNLETTTSGLTSSLAGKVNTSTYNTDKTAQGVINSNVSGQITTLTGTTSGLTSSLATTNGNVTALAGRVTTLEGTVGTQGTAITMLNGQVSGLTTSLAGKVDNSTYTTDKATQGVINDTLIGEITANTSSITALASLLPQTASNTPVAPISNLTGVNVQTCLQSLETKIENITTSGSGLSSNVLANLALMDQATGYGPRTTLVIPEQWQFMAGLDQIISKSASTTVSLQNFTVITNKNNGGPARLAVSSSSTQGDGSINTDLFYVTTQKTSNGELGLSSVVYTTGQPAVKYTTFKVSNLGTQWDTLNFNWYVSGVNKGSIGSLFDTVTSHSSSISSLASSVSTLNTNVGTMTLGDVNYVKSLESNASIFNCQVLNAGIGSTSPGSATIVTYFNGNVNPTFRVNADGYTSWYQTGTSNPVVTVNNTNGSSPSVWIQGYGINSTLRSNVFKIEAPNNAITSTVLGNDGTAVFYGATRADPSLASFELRPDGTVFAQNLISGQYCSFTGALSYFSDLQVSGSLRVSVSKYYMGIYDTVNYTLEQGPNSITGSGDFYRVSIFGQQNNYSQNLTIGDRNVTNTVVGSYNNVNNPVYGTTVVGSTNYDLYLGGIGDNCSAVFGTNNSVTHTTSEICLGIKNTLDYPSSDSHNRVVVGLQNNITGANSTCIGSFNSDRGQTSGDIATTFTLGTLWTVANSGDTSGNIAGNTVRLGDGTGANNRTILGGGPITLSGTTQILRVGIDANGNRPKWTIMRDTSARKYKENIKPISFDVNNFMKLQSVEYDRVAGGHEVGFIAEEVEACTPEFVNYYEGQVDGVNYDRMVTMLVNVVQQQQKEINDLKEVVKTLIK